MAPSALAEASPPAQGLCTQAAAGTLDGDLLGKDAQVTAACDAQRASYAAAETAFATTQTALRARADAARAAADAACATPPAGAEPSGAVETGRRGGPSAACQAARAQARAALKQIRTELRAARETRHGALKLARDTFRAALRSLAAPTA